MNINDSAQLLSETAQQITWVYTQDLDGTCQFYAESLGLEQVLDQGACRIFRSTGDSFIGICNVRPGREMNPNGVVISFVTNDVDGWYQRLLARGVTFDAPPELSNAFNVYSCFARDPNGYRIEFQRFVDPKWPVKKI